MFLPIPIKPIVKNERGEAVINPLLRSVKGITLQPSSGQASATIPAATGNRPGSAPSIIYESPFAGYTEIFSLVGAGQTGSQLEIFSNIACTRYGGRYWSSRPIPYPFMFGRSGNGTLGITQLTPSFHEISVAPIIGPQQTVTIDLYNIRTSAPMTCSQVIEGRLIESGVNTMTKGMVFEEYTQRGKNMPYWLTCEQNIKIGGLSTGMPGLTFTTTGDSQQTAVFVNKYPETFVAVAMMVAAYNTSATTVFTESSKFNVRLITKANHELSNQPIPMIQMVSDMTQPYFFNHPIVMTRGEDFRMDVTVRDGVATPNAKIFCTLFGMSLL